MSTMHNEGAIRPNEKKNHVSATNAALWETIETDGKWNKTTFEEHINALKWFDISHLAYKDTTDGKKSSREYFVQTSSEVSSLDELKENYKAFASFLNAIADAANAEALNQFHTLAAADEDYAKIMNITNNLSVEWSLNQKQSGKLAGKEIIKTKKGQELTFFKYAVDTEKMSVNQAFTIFDKAKVAVGYQTEIAKAKAEEEARKNAEMAAAKEMEELKKQLAEQQKMIQQLLAAQNK